MPQSSRYSLRELPGKVLRRVRRWVYYKQTMILYSRPITETPTEGLELQIKSYDQHPEVIDVLKRAYPKRVEVIDQRLRLGLKFIAVFTPEGDLMGSCWYGLGQFVDPIGRFEIPMGKEDIYSYDGIVEPNFRRSKHATTFYPLMIGGFWPLGFRRVIAAIDATNQPALMWHYYIGFREMGQKVEITFLFRRPRHQWSTYVPAEGPPQASS